MLMSFGNMSAISVWQAVLLDDASAIAIGFGSCRQRSRSSKIAPTVIALSAMLKAGKAQPPMIYLNEIRDGLVNHAVV